MSSALWRFTRPHAFIGTLVSIIALYVIALTRAGVSELALDGLVVTLVSAMTAAVFIVGLNQYYDVDIDRINKPDLPYASHELTASQVRLILLATLGCALVFAFIGGRWLVVTVATSLAIGWAYSAPPLRLKRSYAAAAACIIAVRAFVINLGLFLHFDAILAGPGDLPSAILLLVLLTVVFSLVIAVSKDITDTEGDSRFGIRTLVRGIGPASIFRFGRLALSAGFFLVFAIAVADLVTGLDPLTLGASQLGLLVALWWRSQAVDPADNEDVKPYYLFLWHLFQLEYVAFAAASLIG